MRRYYRHPILWFIVAVAAIPFVVPALGSTVRLATEILVTILFALSFNFLLGYTGQLSFGHAAYYGLGAYTAALLQLKLWPSVLGPILMAPLLSGMAAVVVGALIIRKRGIYFSLLTLAFAQLFYFIVFEWRNFTGGEYGLGGISRLPLFGLPIEGIWPITFLLPFLLSPWYFSFGVLSILLCRVLQAIRDNENRAACLGYDTRFYKFLSFVISGIFAGLAGGLSAFIFCYVSVDSLHWSASGFVVMMTLIGGVQTFFGPAIGAFIYVLAKDLLSSFTEHWMIPFGIIFVLFVIFASHGIGGLLRFSLLSRREVLGKRNQRPAIAKPLPETRLLFFLLYPRVRSFYRRNGWSRSLVASLLSTVWR